MNKQIEAIFVNRKHEGKTYISVNFGSRYTAGNITFDKATKKYSYSNLTAEQITEARALAFNSETKKWENWTRTQMTSIIRKDEEELENEEAERFYNRPTITPAESEIYG